MYSDTKNAPYELVVMNKDIVEFLLRAEGSEYHHYPVLHSSGGVRIDPAGAPCELSPEITHIVQRAKEWIHGYAAKMKTGVWMMDELS